MDYYYYSYHKDKDYSFTTYEDYSFTTYDPYFIISSIKTAKDYMIIIKNFPYEELEIDYTNVVDFGKEIVDFILI